MADIDAINEANERLARALELLLELDDDVDRYLDSDPIEIVRQPVVGGGKTALVLRERSTPPLSLAVRVGEAVHHLRSTADNLAQALVRAAGNSPTRRTAFPVLLHPPANGLQIYGGVTGAALSEVDALQPYHRRSDPQNHPLAVLNDLWNADKHRRLRLGVAQLVNPTVALARPGLPPVEAPRVTRVARGGDVLAIFAHDASIPADTEIIAEGQLFLGFLEPGNLPKEAPVTSTLETLHGYIVMTVVPRIAKHL